MEDVDKETKLGPKVLVYSIIAIVIILVVGYIIFTILTKLLR